MTVISGPGLSLREKFCFLHPAMSAFKHFSRVWLEHQPFPRTETVDIDNTMIFFRQLFQKVVLVALRLQIDVTLRPLWRVEITLYVFYLGILVQQKTDHGRWIGFLNHLFYERRYIASAPSLSSTTEMWNNMS